jgi:hypothetical protein
MNYFPAIAGRTEDLLESIRKRRIPETEADAAKSYVREHGIGSEIVGENRTGDEPGRSRWYAPDTQVVASETGERLGELGQANRIAIDDETSRTCWAAAMERASPNT